MSEKAKKRVLYRQADRLVDYQDTFNSEKGKRVLFDLMKAHNYLGNPKSNDPYDILRDTGQRDVIHRILTLLDMNPSDYKKFIDQQIEQENSYDRDSFG